MKIGQKVLLNIRRKPEQSYEIIFIGPFSVKIKDERGFIYIVKKSKVRFQLYGPPKERRGSSTSVDAISVPMGGQPNSKK